MFAHFIDACARTFTSCFLFLFTIIFLRLKFRHEKILSDVAPFARAAGVPDSRDLVFAHFIDRVRENLHIVLCMSPVGDQLRNRFRMFPSLVNCCTIDWFNEWPKEALLSVSTKFLAGMKKREDDREENRIKVELV